MTAYQEKSQGNGIALGRTHTTLNEVRAKAHHTNTIVQKSLNVSRARFCLSQNPKDNGHGVGVIANHVARHFQSRDASVRQVLASLDLVISPSEFVAIVGKSGCGKSTLLRLLAGLDRADKGEIFLFDGVLSNGELSDANQPRLIQNALSEVRIMFQEARLLPWKRVIDNVALGLPGPRAKRRDAAMAMLEEVGLSDRAQDWVLTLSGGQRQRVALARALVHRPRLLLLDEPLGALDALTRIEMQRLIERLWRQHHFTAVLVTHDVAEAVTLADRVVLIESGKISLTSSIDLLRPRHRAATDFAALEGQVLARLLNDPTEEGKVREVTEWHL